ncbi:MAG TPA: hypothetical protein VFP54_08705 [Acidimicrobiales bacterium]|nr:hypothetical protein [Acidimicrobiales bacterium]
MSAGVAIAALAGLVAAGCGGSSGHNTSTSGTTKNVTVAKSGGVGEGPYPWKYPASGSITVGSGTTVSGTKCTANGPQFDSPYAPPCIAKFTGSNGGATYNGVTANQILIANRTFPSTANAQQTAAVAKAQGYALPQVTQQVRQVFLDYFNKVYDLYGRKVVIQDVNATGNSTQEALNQGQSQACADADNIANQVHAFGELGLGENFTGAGGSGPFSQCAVQQKLVEFSGGAYFDETWYQQQNPYVWDVPMDCERISTQLAEATDKLLVGKPAQYAGDPALQSQTRKFGTYVPNLPQYSDCVTLFKQLMENKYHVPASTVDTEFTYGLDISTFQQSAQQAMVQFKAAGVTTIITACDSYSLSLMTKAAATQNYHPEWYMNGVALDDTDTVAQTYDQSEVTGHLFGLSEAAPQDQFFGPNSPAGKLYQKLTGHEIPAGTDGNYGTLVRVFDMLQAAGPDLTPQTMAEGTHSLPAMGAPNYQYGLWNFNQGPSGAANSGDHTAIADARFVYWDGKGTSPVNGKAGTFIPIFDGKRYGLGQWPSTLPALFTQS